MSSTVTMKLCWQEARFLADIGSTRKLRAMAKRVPEPYGEPTGDRWSIDIESCAAEFIVAKHMGMFWPPYSDHPGELPGDVGTLQIRSTPRKDGRLIVHERDKDEAIFVLVRGQIPEFEIAGWIRGADCKQPRYMFEGDGRPAYFVAAEELRPMHELTSEAGQR
jgi:hypothetical protein